MTPKHLLSISLGTHRLTVVILSRGISLGHEGVSFVTKRLSWVWVWPWRREVPGHPYASEIGLYYRTLRELKDADGKPNVAIELDKLNRIH